MACILFLKTSFFKAVLGSQKTESTEISYTRPAPRVHGLLIVHITHQMVHFFRKDGPAGTHHSQAKPVVPLGFPPRAVHSVGLDKIVTCSIVTVSDRLFLLS